MYSIYYQELYRSRGEQKSDIVVVVFFQRGPGLIGHKAPGTFYRHGWLLLNYLYSRRGPEAISTLSPGCFVFLARNNSTYSFSYETWSLSLYGHINRGGMGFSSLAIRALSGHEQDERNQFLHEVWYSIGIVKYQAGTVVPLGQL